MGKRSKNQVEGEVALPLGPGDILRQAREAARLTQEEIAAKLRLSVHRIHELEANDFSQMKAVIYAQGYLRAYADLVKVPAESVLDSFKNLEWFQRENNLSGRQNSKWLRIPLPTAHSWNHLWVYLGAIAATFVVGVLILDYWSAEKTEQPTYAVTSSATTEIPLTTAAPDNSLPVENTVVQKPKHQALKAPIVEAQPSSAANRAAQ